MTALCLGKVSKDFSVDNMKKTGFSRYANDFSFDNDVIPVDVIRMLIVMTLYSILAVLL